MTCNSAQKGKKHTTFKQKAPSNISLSVRIQFYDKSAGEAENLGTTC